jgi:adenylate cyclase
MELGALDRLVIWQPAPPRESAVTLVWIGEAEIVRWGHPLPDQVLADALRAALAAGPSVVGMDIYRDRDVPPGSAQLEEILTTARRVIVVEKLPDATGPGVAAPAYVDRERIAFADVPIDVDGVTRRLFLMLWDEQDRFHPSFSLQLALRHLAADGIALAPAPGRPDHVRLGASVLPPLEPDFGGYANLDAGGYQLLLDHRAPSPPRPQFTLTELLEGRIPGSATRGRIVVLATASPSVKDHFATSGDNATFGGELHALATDQLVRLARGVDRPVASLPAPAELGWLFTWCVAGALAGIRVRNPAIVALTIASGLTALFASAAAAFAAAYWLPVAAPALAGAMSFALAVAYCSRRERIEKAELLGLFGRFVSRGIVERLWSEREAREGGALPRPERARITALVTDLSGFTSAVATLDPSVVMSWIGAYMDAMAGLVERHGGVVSDFTGDGVMAYFGVPLIRDSEDATRADARRAVQCAIDMTRALESLNRTWQSSQLPPARMRVGIATGPVVVGTYGSRDRLKYAAVGTTVNVAARLEGLDKESFDAERSGSRILVAEATWRLLDSDVDGVRVGEVTLRGLPEAIVCYRILPGEAVDSGAPGDATA